jgi:1,4-alpha-glucan branching enzyme
MTPGSAAPEAGEAELVERLAAGELAHPQMLLGPRLGARRRRRGTLVRTWHPEAVSAELRVTGQPARPMRRAGVAGVFEAFLPGETELPAYRIRLEFPEGESWEREDPYRFPSTLGELDLHLFAEGTHRRLWEVMGAHPRCVEGVEGVAFAVWAPNARAVSVVGDFCHWDGRLFPMCHRGGSGVFELFVPDLEPGALYKFEIKTARGARRIKTDPFARRMERPPGSASIVERSGHRWSDEAWMRGRERDPRREPMAIYEVHLGSWARVPEEGNRPLGYREIAPRLAQHAKRLGFTHLELMPVSEYPFDDSWGYQVSGYFAPTSRYGSPDDLRFMVDYCHQQGLGVILDWVPAHFPRDDFALRRFDGAPLFEYADPRLGEHPDWGTLVFDYCRNEVRNFLVANALYWLEEFHIDGLRVDAVASMLYRDYSRAEGEWAPNLYGGRENLEAIRFLQELNEVVGALHPGCFTVAEESTAWPGVTRPVSEGGLGFAFKWNMGWMNDTLRYFAREPVHRGHHHDELTFAALYEHSERFIMPLSHDEGVHGKRSLLEKMPGDEWQKLANLRLLFAYQWTRPGKKLLFMGSELAPWEEWNHRKSLDWHLAEQPERQGLLRLLEQLGRLYHEHPCLWRSDPDPEGFRWIDCEDHVQSVVSYLRRHQGDELLVVMNATPVPRDDYRVGAPNAGRYRELLCSDHSAFGGSGYTTRERVETEPHAYHGCAESLRLRLPPLACLVLGREP